ncbi:MAG: glucosamine-6-phosphate deaminase [Bacillota bacterium]
MKIHIFNTPERLSEEAAKLIIRDINKKPNLVLGLSTGETPLKTYKKLIAAYENNKVDFSNVITFNLDEYIGLGKNDPNSYHYYMHQNFFDWINIKEDNIHLLDGLSKDYDKLSLKYDKLINEYNGIDLQILGIGINGHIGFNEPDTKLSINTHVTTLSETTITQNNKYFSNKSKIPTHAITMGLGNIMQAKKILLLATGKRKAHIMADFLKKSYVSTNTPASALLLHQNLIIMMDKDAAKLYEKEMNSNENNYKKYKNYHSQLNSR